MLKVLRRRLSAKLAHWSLVVHPTAGEYRRQWGTKYHVGHGAKCPNDPDWK